MTTVALNHYPFTHGRPILFDTHTHPLIPEPILDIHLPLEFGVVLDGLMDRYTNGVKTTLSRGGVWIAGILEPHGRQAQIAGTRVAVFIISTEYFYSAALPGVESEWWLAPFMTPARSRPLLSDETFADLAEELIEYSQRETDEQLINAQIQLTLMSCLVHANRLGTFAKGASSSGHDVSCLRPAIERIYSSPAPISTPQAAELCHLSTHRFSKLFKQVTGLSFSKFSLRYRLSRAAEDLRRTDCSLDEVADAWGFADKSHLVHRFKEHYQITPARYCDQHRTS